MPENAGPRQSSSAWLSSRPAGQVPGGLRRTPSGRELLEPRGVQLGAVHAQQVSPAARGDPSRVAEALPEPVHVRLHVLDRALRRFFPPQRLRQERGGDRAARVTQQDRQQHPRLGRPEIQLGTSPPDHERTQHCELHYAPSTAARKPATVRRAGPRDASPR